MATLLKVLINLADIKSAGGVALRVRTQARLQCDVVPGPPARCVPSGLRNGLRLRGSRRFRYGEAAPETTNERVSTTQVNVAKLIRRRFLARCRRAHFGKSVVAPALPVSTRLTATINKARARCS